MDEQSRDARNHQIVTLRGLGFPQRQIAADVGVSRSTVARALALDAAHNASIPTGDVSRVQAANGVRRISVDKANQGFAASFFPVILPPPDHDQTWRSMELERDTFGKASPAELIRMLTSLSPEISRAVWDWLRLLDPGHEVTAFVPGKDDEPDDAAQQVLNQFLDTLRTRYSSLKVLTGRMFMGAITRGAFFTELVLDDAGRLPLDLATPDPASARFRKGTDPDLGTVWQLGQWQGGQFVPLDRPTIRYVPIDPEPGNPYGRSMLTSALFPAIFLLGVLHDLRRVVAQQGYPRIDLTIKLEAIKAAYPKSATNEKQFREMVEEITELVSNTYGSLEPDDAFVHTDDVGVGQAAGVVESGALRGAGDMITSLERMATKALKTMPLMMGITDGVSEANANRQWEIFAAGIKSLQHLAEAVLGELFTLALSVQGVQAHVRFQFHELRAAEEQRDALSLRAKLENAILAETQGYMDRDEAATYAVGHAAVSEAPAVVPTIDAPPDENPEPGSDRSRREKVEPEGDVADLPAMPTAVEVADNDLTLARGAWDAVMAGYEGLLNATVKGGDAA